MRGDTARKHLLRGIRPGELAPLRGVLAEVGRAEMLGRVRIGGTTYYVRALRRGPSEWSLDRTPETRIQP